MPRGVRHVFQYPEGYKVFSLDEIEHGCAYIVSSTNSFRRLQYGTSKVQYWSNKPPSAARYRRNEHTLFTNTRNNTVSRSYPASRTNSHQSFFSEPLSKRGVGNRPRVVLKPGRATRAQRPRVLTIISNTQRQSREKVCCSVYICLVNHKFNSFIVSRLFMS